MRKKHFIYSSIIASVLFFAGGASAESTSTEPTFWGIYGAHDKHDCPVNNRETAKEVIAASTMDLQPLMKKYGVTAILDQYHSGLEHTFLWVVETKEPHKLEEFSIELGIARWNDLKFVPLLTFKEGVVPDVRAIHGLEAWETGKEVRDIAKSKGPGRTAGNERLSARRSCQAAIQPNRLTDCFWPKPDVDTACEYRLLLSQI